MTPELCEIVLRHAAGSRERIKFYYSDLASRKEANPTGFATAVRWWLSVLADATNNGLLGPDRLTFQLGDDLIERLRMDSLGRPSALGTVVSELLRTGSVTPYDDYASAQAPSRSFLHSAAIWATSRLAVLVGSRPAEGDEAVVARLRGFYTIPGAVDAIATTLWDTLKPQLALPLGRLYSLDLLQQEYGSTCCSSGPLTLRDMRLVVHALVRMGRCTFADDVIKFCQPGEQAQSQVVSATDRSIVSLKTTLAAYDRRIDECDTRISKSQLAIVDKLSANDKPGAKVALTRRKRNEELRDQSQQARARLQAVLDAIENAQTNEETVAALSLGTSALQSILASPTLQIQHIEDTREALSQVMERAAEVDSAMTGPSVEADEYELEKELENLIIEDQRENTTSKDSQRPEDQRTRQEERLRDLTAPTAPASTSPQEARRSSVVAELTG